ncbi:MAG: 23S rRNA (adenine(2503)-C(2))-methyltransferase RlmN [Saprospiraceae bacterium]
MNKEDIRRYSFEELTNIILSLGESKFRAKQIYEWIWQKGAFSFDEMTNISIKLRDKLKESYTFNTFILTHKQVSKDCTIKLGWKLFDGSVIESVLIPLTEENRYTLCVSSQVGCSLNCTFCATGKLKLRRNLFDYEIIEQFIRVNKISNEVFGHNLTNIVYMGMGEPLLNYDNVIKSVEKLTSPDGFGYSNRRITISTSGIIKGIERLINEDIKVNLALSLHAPDDEKRTSIMAINKSNPINELVDILTTYYDKNKTKISYEYIMFKDLNDSLNDAKNLVKLTRRFPVKVNIIEYNYVEGVPYSKASEDRINTFAKHLVDNGVMATVRRSRGKDIDAACGQLANKVNKK